MLTPDTLGRSGPELLSGPRTVVRVGSWFRLYASPADCLIGIFASGHLCNPLCFLWSTYIMCCFHANTNVCVCVCVCVCLSGCLAVCLCVCVCVCLSCLVWSGLVFNPAAHHPSSMLHNSEDTPYTACNTRCAEQSLADAWRQCPIPIRWQETFNRTSSFQMLQIVGACTAA